MPPVKGGSLRIISSIVPKKCKTCAAAQIRHTSPSLQAKLQGRRNSSKRTRRRSCPFCGGEDKLDIFSFSVVNRNAAQPAFWPAALLRRTSVFAPGENRGAGVALPTPTMEIPKGGAAPWAAEPTKKDTTYVVSFFVVRAWGLEPQRITAREPKSRMSTNSIMPADFVSALRLPERRVEHQRAGFVEARFPQSKSRPLYGGAPCAILTGGAPLRPGASNW